MMVLLTDGRANVSLAKSNDDPDAIGPDAVKPTTVRSYPNNNAQLHHALQFQARLGLLAARSLLELDS